MLTDIFYLFKADLRHIQALRSKCLEAQDATVMRQTWESALNQDLDARGRDSAQAKYSLDLSKHLLAPAHYS